MSAGLFFNAAIALNIPEAEEDSYGRWSVDML